MSEFRKAPRAVALFAALALGTGALTAACGSSEKNDADHHNDGMINTGPSSVALADIRCASRDFWARPREKGYDPAVIAKKLGVYVGSIEQGSIGPADCGTLLPPSTWADATAQPMLVNHVPFEGVVVEDDVRCWPVDTAVPLDFADRKMTATNSLVFVCPNPNVTAPANPLPPGGVGPAPGA